MRPAVLYNCRKWQLIDWQEPMVLQRKLRPSIARVNVQLDPRHAASKHTTAHDYKTVVQQPIVTRTAVKWLMVAVNDLLCVDSLVSSQTVDEVLVKAGSSCCILPGIVPHSSDPDSATLAQVVKQSPFCVCLVVFPMCDVWGILIKKICSFEQASSLSLIYFSHNRTQQRDYSSGWQLVVCVYGMHREIICYS